MLSIKYIRYKDVYSNSFLCVTELLAIITDVEHIDIFN